MSGGFVDVCFCVFLQPGFAASLQILKVEIGGDSQSTGLWQLHYEDDDDDDDNNGFKYIFLAGLH